MCAAHRGNGDSANPTALFWKRGFASSDTGAVFDGSGRYEGSISCPKYVIDRRESVKITVVAGRAFVGARLRERSAMGRLRLNGGTVLPESMRRSTNSCSVDGGQPTEAGQVWSRLMARSKLEESPSGAADPVCCQCVSGGTDRILVGELID